MRSRRSLDQRDQRGTARRDLSYPLAIELPADGRLLPCMMNDISKGGARVTLREDGEVPDRFVLRLDNAGRATRQCRLVWRRGNELGVAFIEPEEP
ncbi:PilZ domain-containing protein [Phreatobacter sp.]|uniref:PilZ domain-containing protein n=1 Tax=Phreatobacter sp. TaxID=1966341 RepID=UPI003F6F5A54